MALLTEAVVGQLLEHVFGAGHEASGVRAADLLVLSVAARFHLEIVRQGKNFVSHPGSPPAIYPVVFEHAVVTTN